jgi:hypothetical protein
MLSSASIVNALRRFARIPNTSVFEHADRAWEIAPGHSTTAPSAFFLEGHRERIRDFAFATREGIDTLGLTRTAHHAPTRGFLLKDATLIDGVVYHCGATLHLHPRDRRLPRVHVEHEIDRAAIYSTPGGLGYFGQWLLDDCVTYTLAEAEGIPVTTAQPASAHVREYEAWLDMKPRRFSTAHFRELVLFEDVGQNLSKRARYRKNADKLLGHLPPKKPHPGVFVVRGATGKRRVLVNELEIAEQLKARRGFTIVDLTKLDVPSLLSACAGARVIAGVEGSHLLHGLVILDPGCSVMTIQHPNRFCPLLKDITDRDGQHFAFMVGETVGEDFHADLGEIERTLDLLPPAPVA